MSSDLVIELLEYQILTGYTHGGASTFTDPNVPLREDAIFVVLGRAESAIQVVLAVA
jgi:hypothetical protein